MSSIKILTSARVSDQVPIEVPFFFLRVSAHDTRLTMARYSISDHAEKYGEEDSGKMLMNADEIIP